MNNIILLYFNKYISSISVFFILIPHVINIYLDSNPIIYSIGSFLVLILIDIFLSQKIKNSYVSVIYISTLIIFFYGLLFYNDTEISLHNLRLREFILLFSILTFVTISILVKNKNGIKFINVFFLMFGCTFILSKDQNKFFDRSEILKTNNFQYSNVLELDVEEKSSLPVILIILDELSSTMELFRQTQDSTELIFDKSLKNLGYTIKSDFKSKSTHTKYSLPSIFNFNIHRNSKLLDSLETSSNSLETIQKSFYWIGSNNLLVDSLKTKSVKSFSYGMFPFSRFNQTHDFNYWWPSFRDPIFMFKNLKFLSVFFGKTIFKPIETKIRGGNAPALFNEEVFQSLKNVKLENNSFYYFHIYGPHEPFVWKDEYEDRDSNISIEDEYLSGHIKFRRFLLNKIFPVLSSPKFKKSRIIIVGDHGFRGSNSINPNLTNLYLYNYPNGIVKDSDVVQDIGYLISNSFTYPTKNIPNL